VRFSFLDSITVAKPERTAAPFKGGKEPKKERFGYSSLIEISV
jgi:hypothetical protein